MDTSLVSCVSYSEEQMDTQETPEKTARWGHSEQVAIYKVRRETL